MATETTGGYRITLKLGYYVVTDRDGWITEAYEGENRRDGPYRSSGHGWRILGFGRRHWANHPQVSLAEAAAGADLGQGWIWDWDHGTIRQWCMPKHGRAVRVEACAAVRHA